MPAEATTIPDSSTVVSIKNVRHVYKKNTEPVLDGLNLSLGTGFFGLLGANGAGKSTLMRMICTLLKPTEGSVHVHGYDVVKECFEVRKLIGYLPQEFNAWRLHRTEEVLDTLARISGLNDNTKRKERVAEVLSMVGLEEVAYRKIKKLSGGMVRRLGVAQALVHEPQVLVVDEPTVGLDPEERMRFRQLMTELGKTRTILLSTHIVADLGSGCHEIALLDGGCIAFQGAPTDLLKLAQGYVYEITTNLQEAEVVDSQYEVVSREAVGNFVRFRVVVEEAGNLPGEVKTVEDPTLEEAYLAFMAARGKLEAAHQEEIEQT